MHLLILPYLDCSDSHAYTISLELCAGFNDSTHKTSLLYFEYVILYAPLHKDKLRTTAGDRGGAGLLAKFAKNLQNLNFANFAKSCAQPAWRCVLGPSSAAPAATSSRGAAIEVAKVTPFPYLPLFLHRVRGLMTHTM